jgi:hypothetical protein
VFSLNSLGIVIAASRSPNGTDARADVLRVLGRSATSCSDLELRGAGDENRTRTISLGSTAVTAATDTDPVFPAAVSDPG